MARIVSDEPTAAAFKAVREIPRDGLSEWQAATSPEPVPGNDSGGHRRGDRCVRRCLQRLVRPQRRRSRPSAAMRDRIPRTPAIQVLEDMAPTAAR